MKYIITNRLNKQLHEEFYVIEALSGTEYGPFHAFENAFRAMELLKQFVLVRREYE